MTPPTKGKFLSDRRPYISGGIAGLLFGAGVVVGLSLSPQRSGRPATGVAGIAPDKGDSSPGSQSHFARPDSLSEWELLARSSPAEAIRKFCLLGDLKSSQSRSILDIIVAARDASPEVLWDACADSGNELAMNLVASKLAIAWLSKDSQRFLRLFEKMPPGTRDMLGFAFAEGVVGGGPALIKSAGTSFESLAGSTGRTEFGSNLVTGLLETSPVNWQQSAAETIAGFETAEARQSGTRAAFRAVVNPIEMATIMVAAGLQMDAILPAFDQELTKRAIANPEFVGNWLNECPAGLVRDHAASSYSKAIHLIDPGAAGVWAQQISDPDIRKSALSFLAPVTPP